MKAIDVLTNLKNYEKDFEFSKYPLSKNEAEIIMSALDRVVKEDIEREVIARRLAKGETSVKYKSTF